MEILKDTDQRTEYALLEGRNIATMAMLKEAGYSPLSMEKILEKRLNVLDKDVPRETREAWWGGLVNTTDALLYHPKRRIKIVLDSLDIKNLNKNSNVSEKTDFALAMNLGAYHEREGVEFSGPHIEKCTGPMDTLEQITSNPILNVLARDPHLLREYSEALFSMSKELYGKTPIIQTHIAPFQNNSVARLWTVTSLEDGSNILGNLDLTNYGGNGRVIGAKERVK